MLTIFHTVEETAHHSRLQYIHPIGSVAIHYN